MKKAIPSRSQSIDQKRSDITEKEYLYVGHYVDADGNYILKVGTTNDLKRRAQEHTRNYRRGKNNPMPKDSNFEYDWTLKLSKYNTLRYEDKTRKSWQEQNIGAFIRNDRFNCGKRKPLQVTVTIRKTYTIEL